MKPPYQVERPERTSLLSILSSPRFCLGVVVGAIVTLVALSCWQVVAPGIVPYEQVK